MSARKERGNLSSRNDYENSSSDAEESENNDENQDKNGNGWVYRKNLSISKLSLHVAIYYVETVLSV